MMKTFPYVLLATLSIISLSSANDAFVIDVATIKEQALSKTHEKIQDGFQLLDIDGNGKLSRRECSGSGSADALKSFPFFSQAEMDTLTKEIDKAFDIYDKDKDGYLSPDEAQQYISYVENLGIDMQMKKMDKNGDGQIAEDEMTSFMTSMPPLEESLAQLQEATKKMEQFNKNPEEYTENFIANVGTNINKEEFSEMDKEKNGQVTPKEYVSYMYKHPNNKELGFSEEDYKNIFDLIDSDKKGYITEQEYIDYNEKQLHDIMSNSSESKIQDALEEDMEDLSEENSDALPEEDIKEIPEENSDALLEENTKETPEENSDARPEENIKTK